MFFFPFKNLSACSGMIKFKSELTDHHDRSLLNEEYY